MLKKLRSQGGMTLVEVLLAVLLTGIISAAMFRVYINQHQAYNVQDNVIEMQQNARAAIDELTRQIRMSGYALPNGLSAFDAFDTDPDTIRIYYKTVSCEAPIEHDMPLPSAELRCDGHDVSCFYDGQIAYIYDPNLESGEFFEISHVQTGSAHIQHNTDVLSRVYPAGSQLMAIEMIKYYIDQSDADHPRLMVQFSNETPQIYAEDIEDLQFTYVLKNGITVDEPVLKADVRQIGIELKARTPRADIESGNIYRYRTYQSKVYLRNLGS
ncbi:MAG: prepilin-type N-terminal cleavage/methylation domain-containing protein [Candidatus Zixiibacteriota bacterium]